MMPLPIRLCWDGRRGVAAWRGAMTILTSAPLLNGNPVHTIEYAPLGDGHIATVQYRPIDPPRDLTPAEVEACRAYLEKLLGEP